jgi:AraC-like DNA-binding protein
LQLNYFLPAEPLRSLVTVYAHAWTGAHAQPTLPAMLPNIYIRLAGLSSYRFGEGPWIPAPRVTILGPTTASYRMDLAPGLELFAVGLLPCGWNSVVRASGCEFSDCIVDGELLWGHRAIEDLCNALQGTLDPNARIRILDSFLMSRLKGAPAVHSASQVIDHWLEHSPDLSLDTLCEQLDVTPRQLRRITPATHGMSPKTLAMKYRCLRAAATLALQGAGGLDEALRAFADQAHLTRDFRHFVGWTPISFARDYRNIAAATFAGRRNAGASRLLSLLS